ncbi:MAG: hypothetical protein WBC93_19270 [Sulfitobacter sp.]
MFTQRLIQLWERLVETGTDIAVITDEDSIYSLIGYYDYPKSLEEVIV